MTIVWRPTLKDAINSLDRQKTEFMVCAESNCKTKKMDPISSSPKVSMWDDRLKLFEWMK
jgi:hypothetical protein